VKEGHRELSRAVGKQGMAGIEFDLAVRFVIDFFQYLARRCRLRFIRSLRQRTGAGDQVIK